MSDPIANLNERFTPEQRKEAGEIVQKNPVIQAAFESVRRGCYESWRDSKPSEMAERERLYSLAAAANMIDAVVNSVIGNGAFDVATREKVKKGQRP